MSLVYKKESIADGVSFTSVIDNRFKTNYISINMITELNSETAKNAVIPLIISKSNNTCKTLSEISRKLTGLYGASISGGVSKFGDSQCIMLNGSCIADRYTLGGEKITSELADTLLKCLLDPNSSSEEFDKMNFELNKQELIDDIDAEINDKQSYAMIRAGKKIFEGEPASISAKGDKETAVSMTSKEVYVKYLNLLKTAQIEIFFAGGGEPDEIFEKFRTAFSGRERNYTGRYTSSYSKQKSEICRESDIMDVAQSKMVIAYKTDYSNQAALRVMNAVFGGTPFSKLFENVREKMSLCYYCSSGYDERKNVVYVDSGVEHDNIEKAENEIDNQLRQITEGNFTDEEFENSRLSLLNSYRTVNDSPYSLVSWYLKCTYNDDILTPEQQIERIKSVTREQVTDAARSLKKDTSYVLTGKGGEN